MAPFDEQTEDRKYQTFEDIEVEEYEKYTTDTYELMELTEEEIEKAKRNIYRKPEFHTLEGKVYGSKYLECFRQEGFLGDYAIDESRIVEVPMTVVYPTFEQYMKEYCGHEDRDPEMGVYGYWKNPNSKWDWYSIGGRWSGLLKLKEPTASGASRGKKSWTNEDKADRAGYVDSAFIKDIDFEAMEAENLETAKKNWANAQNCANSAEKYFRYGVRGDADTEEEYLKRNTSFDTFAVLKDGKWYEKGSMGWWGVVHDEDKPEEWREKFRALLKELDPETRITVVDCHI